MQPAADVEEIAQEIRRRLARQGASAQYSLKTPVETLLAGDDAAFIAAIYRKFVNRDPDPEESAQLRADLESGRKTRIDALLELSGGKTDGIDLAGHVYDLEDLLGYPVPESIDNAYRCLLKRDPSAAERAAVIEQLSANPDARFDFFRELAASPEARAANVYLRPEPDDTPDGRTVRRLRAEVAALMKRQQQSDASLRQELEAVRLMLTTLFESKAGKQDIREVVADHVNRRDFDQFTISLREELVRKLAELGARKVDIQELEHALSVKPDLAHVIEMLAGKADSADIRALQTTLHTQKMRILDIERRVGLVLEESRKKIPNDAVIASQLSGVYDNLYLELENIFRGTREEIKERQSFYARYLREIPESAGRRAVDVGCGRGEFLEILAAHGFEASGVDSNGAMVEQCRKLGLNAHHADAAAYLRNQAAESFAAVSAFHVVEHLTTEQLLAFLAESLRILKSGGILILETPNPENLLMATRHFYADPTHRHPLPSSLLRFLVEAKGFIATDVQPLHPAPDFMRPVVRESELLEELLYGPQDYGLIARKP